MLLVQKWPFLQLFCLRIIDLKNILGYPSTNNAFLGYKKRSLNSRKTDIFPEGLTHGIGPKRAIFPTFFFERYRPGKCILRYSRKKNAFLGYKNKKFK